PDLSGFDIDVSMYVRDADDTDVRLFWRPTPNNGDGPPEDAPEPVRDELCSAPIGRAKELVKRAAGRAWRWDALARGKDNRRRWSVIQEDGVFPGLILWIDASVGGYDAERGFDVSSKDVVREIPVCGDTSPDMDGDPDSFMSKVRVSLARHTEHVHCQAEALAEALGLGGCERELLLDTALWHDWGKAHKEGFVARIPEGLRGGIEGPLAKWPRVPKGTPRPTGARKYF